ncbi:MAG: glycosyltransferase family 2 protein [Clostridia bacterium]|nr:glycosyltransferase family 2 protein [Clostridia bacterium]
MSELVSVIMAAYNAEQYVEQAISSLQRQTYVNIEIIVCDDHSTDSTFDIISKIAESDPRIKVIRNDKNLLAASARNKCLSLAKGKYIAIQDADDLSRPDRIELLVKAIEEKPEYDFVSSDEALFDKDPDKPYRIVGHKKEPTKKSFLRGMCFCHAGTLFKRECLMRVGGYPVLANIRRHEDYLLFMILYSEGYRGFNVDECLYFYRVDSETLARRGIKSCLQECRIRAIGFRKMRLFLVGIPFLFIPVLAYFRSLFRKKENGK